MKTLFTTLLILFAVHVMAQKDSILHIELDIELDPVTPDTTRINIDSVKWSDFGERIYGKAVIRSDMDMEEFKSKLRKRTIENRKKFESENYDEQYYLQKGTNDWNRFKEGIQYRTDKPKIPRHSTGDN